MKFCFQFKPQTLQNDASAGCQKREVTLKKQNIWQAIGGTI